MKTKQWTAAFSGEDLRMAEELMTLLEAKRGITLSQACSVKQAVRAMVEKLRGEPSLSAA